MDDVRNSVDKRSYVRIEPTFLPEPAPRDLWCPIISVDDHLLEPPDVFSSRVPARVRDAVPQMRPDDDGVPVWIIDGVRHPIVITDGAAGRPMSEWKVQPSKFEDFRRGVWDPVARLGDMDLAGIWGSLNFPSTVFGFAGWRLAKLADSDARIAAVRAYNDWVIDEWCAADMQRFLPCQIPCLSDPDMAAQEVRKNAERGFTSVSFSENPEPLGFASLYSGEWDKFFKACADTATVVNLHVGSSGMVSKPSNASPAEVSVALFPMSGIATVIDWIYARIPIKFPDLRVVVSEAGVSWVPMAVERLRRAYRQREASQTWKRDDPDPVELLGRNFWFTSIEDPSAFRLLDVIGEDRIMLEADFPHPDSSWPDTQEMAKTGLAALDDTTIERICYDNAVAVYRASPPPKTWTAKARARRNGELSVAASHS